MADWSRIDPARLVRGTLARLRPVVYSARRIVCVLSRPGVVLGRDVRIEAAVELRATDGGRIVLADGCRISRGTTIIAQGGVVSIGSNAFVGPWTVIASKAAITIGDHAQIAERVTIRDQDHRTDHVMGTPIRSAGFSVAPVMLGEDVWLGAGVVVLKGVTMGNGAIAAANAVVNRDVASLEIVGGVPAKRIGVRSRGSE